MNASARVSTCDWTHTFVDGNIHLSTFLRSVHADHVVSEKLLQELHLSHAEVEVQTAGHVHLQGVATHHHLLGDSVGRENRTVCELSFDFVLLVLVYSLSNSPLARSV